MDHLRMKGPRTLDRSEHDLLQAFVLQKDRTWIISHPDPDMTRLQRQRLGRLIAQRQRGFPMAYLTGGKEFFGRDFSVGRGVLIPRPETEHLVEQALAYIPANSPWHIIDVGTGSGCIAITIAAERPNTRVTGLDLSPTALRYARKNARVLSLRNVRFMKSNLLEKISKEASPDMIVANLPYLKPGETIAAPFEPRLALISGRDGLVAFRKFFQQCKKLKRPSIILLEIDPRRVRQVQRLAQTAFPKSNIAVTKDLAGRARVVTILPS